MSIELAEKYEEEEQYEKAYEEYKTLLKSKPKSIELLQKTAHLACILDKQEEAETYFTKILEDDKTNTLAYEQLMDMFIETDKFKYYTYRGNLHVIQGQLQHATGDFKKALDKAPDENTANATRFVLANLYSQTGKENKAIDEYLRIVDTHNAPEEIYLNLAKIYCSQDVLPSAIDILERAIKDGHETENVKKELAELYLKNNQTCEASKLSKDELVQLRCLIEDGNFDEAENKINSIKDNYKKNSKFLALVAQFYFEQKDFEKALQYVEEFSKFDKNSPLIYQMRALIYEEQNMPFEEHYNWGKYHQARGNNDIAINEFMFAHQANPNDSALITKIAELLEEMKDSTQAIEFYEKLYNLEPNNTNALEKLGEFRMHIGDYKMAIEYLEKLYELKTNKTKDITRLMAIAYEKTKNAEKAIEFYEKYLKSSTISEQDVLSIKHKIEKLENKRKEYTDSSTQDGGLIDVIMKFFGK